MTTTPELEQIDAAIRSPHFSHTRIGDRVFRGYTLIYHFDPASPSGVSLVCAGESPVVDPLIRRLRATSPLSPGER
jgi:hypothetical protein